MRLRLHRHDSPLGTLLLVTDEQGQLRALDFDDFEARMHRLLNRHYGQYALQESPTPATLSSSLQDYFDGDLSALDNYPSATNGTAFQRKVWQALPTIPAGTTMTYGQLALRIGCPTASRAVGLANGANPLAIIVPCHRVVGSTGKLTGYGGGIERKRWLLDHEQKFAGIRPPAAYCVGGTRV